MEQFTLPEDKKDVVAEFFPPQEGAPLRIKIDIDNSLGSGEKWRLYQAWYDAIRLVLEKYKPTDMTNKGNGRNTIDWEVTGINAEQATEIKAKIEDRVQQSFAP